MRWSSPFTFIKNLASVRNLGLVCVLAWMAFSFHTHSTTLFHRKLPAGDELQAFPPVRDTNQELGLRSLKDAERHSSVAKRPNSVAERPSSVAEKRNSGAKRPNSGAASKRHNDESPRISEVSPNRPNVVVARQADGQTRQVKPDKPQTMQKPGHRNHSSRNKLAAAVVAGDTAQAIGQIDVATNNKSKESSDHNREVLRWKQRKEKRVTKAKPSKSFTRPPQPPATKVSAEGMIEIDQTMQKRVQALKQACRESGLDRKLQDALHTPNPWEYIVNKEAGLVWCNIFKSASSSWMYVFNVLAGYEKKFLDKTKKVPLQLARDKYGRPSLADILTTMNQTNSVAFLVGRNPFERLVSAYRDKIQNAFPRSEHDKIRRKIIERYRNVTIPKTSLRLSQSFIPTFSEFVRFIVEEHESGSVLDMHWSPVHSFCTPCQFNLTDIVLFETQDQDMEYILRKTGVHDRVGVVQKNRSKGPGKTHDMTQRLISELSRSLYNGVVRLYSVDFKLFGYPIPTYAQLHPDTNIKNPSVKNVINNSTET